MDELVQQIHTLRRRFELAQAETMARRTLAEVPHSGSLMMALGRILLASGKEKEAAEMFRRAGQVHPDDDAPFAWQIAALSRQGRFTEAITLGEAAQDRFPRSYLICIALGRSFRESSRPGEALRCFSDAARIAPKNPTSVSWHAVGLSSLHHHAEAEAVLEETIREAPESTKLHYRLARVCLSRHNFDKAIERFNIVLEKDPYHVDALEWRITALRSAHRFNEAEAKAEEAIARLPRAPALHVEYAWLLSGQDRYDEALARIEQALTLDPNNFWTLRSRVDFLRWARRLDEAEQAATDAIQRRPDDPDLFTAAAWVLSGQDRYDEALARIEQALTLDPNNSEALSSRVDFLRLARRLDEAEQAATDAIQRRPDDPDLFTTAAWVLRGQDRYDEALARIEQALTLDPNNSWALRSRIDFLRFARRLDEAEQAATDAIQRRPDDPDIHTTAAWVLSGQDRYDEALARIEQALTLDPNNPAALIRRIDFLRFARRLDEAEQAATDAIQRRPDNLATHITAAWVLSDQDRYDEALARIEQALTLDPNSSGALSSRVDFLRLARRLEEAEQAATDAIQRHPHNPYLLTAAAWVLSGQDRYDEALARIEQALTLDPNNSWALRSRIDFLRFARRLDEAEQAATDAIQRRPKDPDIHTTAAWVLSDEDRYDEALARIEQALTLDPNNSWALRSRVDFLRWARRLDEAELAATDAIQRRPKDPDIHTTAAWVLSGQDRYDEALARIEQALTLDPNDSWALHSRVDFLRFARRLDEAEQAATDAIQRRPHDPQIRVAAGWLYDDLMLYESALLQFERALLADPRHALAHEWRITELRNLYRFDEAEQAAIDAFQYRRHDPDINIELGRLHAGRRSFDSALACFAAALQLEPEHIEANIARSETLRALRRGLEAERMITRLSHRRPNKRNLKFELAWIHHDAHRLDDARRLFQDLLDTAINRREQAEALNGLGWVAFAKGQYTTAEKEFRAALDKHPVYPDYELGLTWSLARQTSERSWLEADRIASQIIERCQQQPSAHACLGILAFKQGNLASSEYHLKKALEIDPYHGSHTDLGALYVHMARYNEAETELRVAIERDWYDTAAHIELGNLFLLLGDDHLMDAERQFRQACATEATSVAATIGLAQALARVGNEADAEATLRGAIARQDKSERWRTHLALARLLVQRGDKQQNSDLHAEAYFEAQRAISLAPDKQADPHFVAGVAQHRMGSLSVETRGRFAYRRRALHHLNECIKRDPQHIEAQRNIHILEREMKAAAPAVWGGFAVASVSFILLATMWVMFFFSNKIPSTMLSITTPVLVGLFTVSTLLPTLIRLKLPGFEADLQAGTSIITPGPTGDVTFGPGRFTVTTGPTGQLPQRM
ncbi:tetratricopeptide repeat protein [Microbispora rosea]|uniref:tetratricopeptide repeat protein n=1 Tax=Microbispora rosea TaxID=58117 RepID=UPI00343949D0